MSRRLQLFLVVTDLAFLAYWLLSALIEIHLFKVPASFMYADYTVPRVRAWNWSFLPLDVAFSVLGLASVAAQRRGSQLWRPLVILSLAFTMAAGGMAVSYWTLLGEFDPGWYLANLMLVIWPLFYLPGLIAGDAGQATAGNRIGDTP
jgi:hypothetical protein